MHLAALEGADEVFLDKLGGPFARTLESHVGRRSFAHLTTGGRGDRSFNDSAYAGVEAAVKDHGGKLSELSPNAVSLGVTSKSYGLPGLRIGWVVTRNTALLARMAALKDYTTICSSGPCSTTNAGMICGSA